MLLHIILQLIQLQNVSTLFGSPSGMHTDAYLY